MTGCENIYPALLGYCQSILGRMIWGVSQVETKERLGARCNGRGIGSRYSENYSGGGRWDVCVLSMY